MELLLLLGFGAYLLSRQNGGTTPPPPPPNGSGSGSGSGAGQSPTQGTAVEFSTLRLPSIISEGKPRPYLYLPYPANVVYSIYQCKQPGGALRSADILDKLQAYTIAYDLAKTGNAYEGIRVRYGRKFQLRQAVDKAMIAYQSAVRFHFTQCTNYAKQL
jgi:hypothetical protein